MIFSETMILELVNVAKHRGILKLMNLLVFFFNHSIKSKHLFLRGLLTFT